MASGLALDSGGNCARDRDHLGSERGCGKFPNYGWSLNQTAKRRTSYSIAVWIRMKAELQACCIPHTSAAARRAMGVTIGGGIAVDKPLLRNAYFTGGTNFTDMPLLDAFQGSNEGGLDVFGPPGSIPQALWARN